MNRRSVFFWTIVTVTGLVTAAQAIPVEWPVAAGGNGHLYEVVSVVRGITWTAASEAANVAGGYLATVTSAPENAFVFSLVDNDLYWNGHAGPWIGGYQPAGSPEPDGGWSWVTGEPFDYTAWSEFQPNNLGGHENTMHYWDQVAPFRDPGWNDVPQDYTQTKAYVIETVPEPGTVLLLAFGGLAALRKRRR